MTILFLARLFYPHIGGVEKHVMEISKKLAKTGHNIIIITEELDSSGFHSERGEESILRQSGIEIIRINPGKEDRFKKFRIWRSLWKIRKVIEKADIIHCHDVFFWYLPFRFIYPRKPVFTTFHGYESFPISKKAIIVREISEKLSFGNICIGDFIKKWYGTKPDYVSYGAVEIPNTKYKIQNTKSAIFIGRLDDQTSILTYNEAFKKLREKYPKFELLIAGDGQYKDKLDEKAKKIGFQKNPEKYFQNYRFAFVSRYLSILEAMAAKRLVFAVYDNPIKEDYLKMTPFASFIIIVNKPGEIVSQIEKIINNPEIEKQMTGNAFEWVRKQTWEEMIKTYIALWNKYYHNEQHEK